MPTGDRRAAEDYLKVIYGHTEWQPEPITPSQLAARLGLAPSTVTEMVKKLVATGQVAHAPYGAVELTIAGREEALRMVRRHRLVETWLVSQYGYGWDEVHDEAEVLEHSLSDRLLDAIDEQLGRPERDPHGDPIPGADGTVSVPEALQLSALAPGERGRIVRISDRDPAVLRDLARTDLGLDDEIVSGTLPAGVAEAIWVVRLIPGS
jgi:DtxR family Mn-dependent transcriptional regulator